jgi:hypothetical protein
MGLRDWFTSKPSQSIVKADSTSSSEALADDKEAFAKVRAAKATEALSLFDEDDPLPIADSPVMAPYDASEADTDELFTEGSESFTNADELEIDDVGELEDPYLSAIVEGDVPETVVFDDEEKGRSV